MPCRKMCIRDSLYTYILIYLYTYILSEKVEFVNSLQFLSCLSPKFRHYATKKEYGNSDQCYICNIIGLFNKRFYAKNIQENFMFFNGLHKANTHLQHNRNYVVFLTSQKTKLLQLFHMLCSAFRSVNSCSVNIGMSEYISKSYNIFLQGIISSCKKVTKVMRKHFFF